MLRIGGLDRAAWDLVVPVAAGDTMAVLAGLDAIRTAGDPVGELLRRLPTTCRPVWSAGGSVGSVLAGMAHRPPPGRPGVQLHWLGPAAAVVAPDEPLAGPLDSLRRVGIRTVVLGRVDRHPRTVRLVAQGTGRILASVGAIPPPRMVELCTPNWPELDVLVVGSAELAADDARVRDRLARVPAVAVVCPDGALTDAERKGLFELAGTGRLRWLFLAGRDPTATALVDSGAPVLQLRDVEVVAGAGQSRLIWTAGATGPRRMPLPRRPRRVGSALGVDEAYAGGYLLGRLTGGAPEAAHAEAARVGSACWRALGARPAPERDLNRVFAELIGRSSDRRDEGGLFDRFRQAAGLVLMSGGQTGVGQLALQAAARLGLPSFCLLPGGCRTETTEGLWPGPDRFGRAHVEELASTRYRYRTWASVYLADGTLIWDFHDSEGCATAREASMALGRPYLDVVPLTDPRQRREQVWEFVTRHGLRVINVEGNRGTLLTTAEADLAGDQLYELLRLIAARLRTEESRPPAEPSEAAELGELGTDRPLAVGVPTVPAQRDLVEAFLAQTYGLAPAADRALVARYPEPALEVVFARPRDLPALLHAGAVDLALCGSDLLDPDEGFRTLLDTGLCPLLQVLVGRPATAGPEPAAVEPSARARTREPDPALAELLATSRVGSQDPALAGRLLRAAAGYHGEIRRVEGTAETWIRRGLLDVAVDTWSTGATAQANGLALLHVFRQTSLVLGADRVAALPPAADRFVRAFADWLTWR